MDAMTLYLSTNCVSCEIALKSEKDSRSTQWCKQVIFTSHDLRVHSGCFMLKEKGGGRGAVKKKITVVYLNLTLCILHRS